MKVPVLTVLITAATCAFASAAETSVDCQVDDSRRTAAEQRTEETRQAAANTARPTVAQREAAERPAPERRRNGKRIPDAELIGPRGAL
jgi:hypothetical protein